MKSIFIFLFILFGFNCFSQTFWVSYTSGNAQISNAEQTFQAKKGAIVQNGQSLILPEESMVVLVFGDKALKIEKPGEYSFNDLTKIAEATKSNLVGRYSDDMRIQLNASKKPVDSAASNKALLFPADSALIISNGFELNILPSFVPGKLVFYRKQKQILAISIASQKVTIDNIGLMDKDAWFGLQVLSGDLPGSNIVYVKWANASEKENAQTELRNLLEELADYPEAIHEGLINAFFVANNYVNVQTQKKE